MTGLHNALDDIAADISPIDPPLERAMVRGRRMRIRRRTQAVAGTACLMAVAVGAVVGIPSAASHPASPLAGTTGAPGSLPLARPVLIRAQPGSTTAYGDASLVNRATLRLFNEVTCTPGQNALGVSDRWKATIGYTAASPTTCLSGITRT
jgi:hypothetical protein